MSVIDTIKELEAEFVRRSTECKSLYVKPSAFYNSDKGHVYIRVGQLHGRRLIVIANINAFQQGKGWMKNEVLAPIKQYLNEQYPEGAILEFENVINKWLTTNLLNKGYQTTMENCLSHRIVVDSNTVL